MENALKSLEAVFEQHFYGELMQDRSGADQEVSSLPILGIAFSGGVDSTFLLRASVEILGRERVKAFTVKSPYIPEWEIEEAKEICSALDVSHILIELGIPASVRENPTDRCYQCKTIVFSEILKAAKEQGCSLLCDGTNFDDTKDYRPGLRALDELGVISPLKLAEFTKDEIRAHSKTFGLSTWDKPPYACLLTRIPYNITVDDTMLRQIESAEVFLMGLGLRGIRVRHHGDIARIEVEEREMEKMLDMELMSRINSHLQSLGFSFVTLDLGGYKTGCYNNGLTV